MKKSLLFVAVVIIAIAAGCSRGPSGKVLVDINGNKITEGDLKTLGEINPRIQTQLDNPAGQKRILDNLVEQELMYEEALKQGINRDPKVKTKIDLYRRVIIAQSLVDAETEKAAKKYYNEHQDEFKKLKFSTIMVKFSTPDEIKKAKKDEKLLSEQEALKKIEELKGRIDKGENFTKLAEENSDDVATKARGGDLGPVSKDDKRLEARGFGPLLAKALEMKVGEVSGPIKTDKGYHIITVTQGLELEPYEGAEQAILFKVRSDIRNNLLARLKKESKIVYPGEEKGKADTKATPPPPTPTPDETKPDKTGTLDKTTPSAEVDVKTTAQEIKKAAIEAAKNAADSKSVEGKDIKKSPTTKTPEEHKAH